MNNLPKISVVIPVYNVERFLRQCLDSAVNQTLKEIEIICVDDGSTDGSGKILDEYAAQDNRVRVIHKENAGYGSAMNIGLDNATGEYFAILESDDFIMKDAYEMLYRAAKQHDADIVRSDYFDYTTSYGRVNLQVKQMSTDYSYYNRLICPNKENEVYTFVMHNWTGIYKVSFLRKCSIRYNETPGAAYQDNGFYFQTFMQTDRLVYIPRPFYCYRVDNPNSSIRDPKKVYTMTEEYQFIREFMSKHPEFEQEMLPVFYARMFRAYHQTFLRISKEYRKEYAEHFHKQFVDAKDKHLLDTGLFSVEERKYLAKLLQSPTTYYSAVFGKRQIFSINTIAKVQHVAQREGWKAVINKAKKKLLR